MGFQAIEVSINLSTPGATPAAIESAVAHLPAAAKFLGTCANNSSVYLFFDVPGHNPHAVGTPPTPSTP